MREQWLSRSDFVHLEFALSELSRTGSYYGYRGHFSRRQQKLKQWVKENMKTAPRKDSLFPHPQVQP